MNNNFSDMGISLPILKAIEEMGFESPTEVQSNAIPYILNHEDVIVMSKTGSGKTAVFGIPILQTTDPKAIGPQALILTPTRELAVQIDSDLKRMSKHLQHKTTAVYGQHNMNIEVQALNKGVSIITGTPGRVFDHIRQGNLKTNNIQFFVLDEADIMLNMGFLDQVLKIIRNLPKNRVTLLFSATIPNEVHKICRDYMKHPVTIEIESQTKTVDTTEQIYYRVNHNDKNTQLNRLLIVKQPDSCMIFCNTRITVDRVQRFLSQKGYAAEALHGEIPQGKRLRTIQQFKQGDFHILVATDVAARGIHIDDLSLVINYDVPTDKDSYVHRIGRTGRAGNGGCALSLVTGEDIMSLYEIEEHIGAMITEVDLPSMDFFNEKRSTADQWIQRNTQKSKPVQIVSDSTVKENQKKTSTQKPSRNYVPNNNNNSNNNNSNSNSSSSSSSDDSSKFNNNNRNNRNSSNSSNNSNTTTFNKVSIDQNVKKTLTEVTPMEQPQADNNVTKPAYTHSADSTSAYAKNGIEPSESNETLPKKNILKSILSHIFNKK